MKCPDCNGSGVIKTPQYLKVDPNEIYYDYSCLTCEGTGEVDEDLDESQPDDSSSLLTTKLLIRLALLVAAYIIFQTFFK